MKIPLLILNTETKCFHLICFHDLVSQIRIELFKLTDLGQLSW